MGGGVLNGEGKKVLCSQANNYVLWQKKTELEIAETLLYKALVIKKNLSKIMALYRTCPWRKSRKDLESPVEGKLSLGEIIIIIIIDVESSAPPTLTTATEALPSPPPLRFFSLPHHTSHAQPPTVVGKMEAQLKCLNIACTILHIWRQFARSVGAY